MSTALPNNRQHSYDELALFVRDDGKLADAFKVEYQVFDVSLGLPGTLVLPVAGREDVTDTDGHFATGCYGVYDSVADAAWTPVAEVAKGRVVWYYTLVEDGPEVVVERKFEVLATTIVTQPSYNLFTAQELVDMALVFGTTIDQSQAHSLTRLWTDRISRYVRRQLYPSYETRRLPWRPDAHLFLPEMLYALESFTPHNDTAVSNDTLLIYGWPHSKGNPRIEMEPETRPLFGLIRMVPTNILGVWGYFDPVTGEPPRDLVETALLTIAEYVADHLGSGAPIPGMAPLKREKTDGHEVEYAIISTEVRSGMLALLRSPELRDQLDLHRAPLSLRMTGAG